MKKILCSAFVFISLFAAAIADPFTSNLVMVGFGAGLTYAGTYCTWPEL